MGSTRVEGELSPPEFLRLAGHELRWRLLSELSHGDRLVGELAALVGQPQNLVSYHLGKLRDAGVASARRSSADGRDTYYTVDLAALRDRLAATGAALHPGLGLVLPAGAEGGPPGDAARNETVAVLFLCTGNSARSQMAEALARTRSGGVVEAYSAGSRPKALHPNALRVMRERGIDIGGQRPKHLDEFTDARFDRVVTLCDRVREVCPEFPGGPEAVHWSIPDPAAGGDDEATYPVFQGIAAELEARIGFLLAALDKPSATAVDAKEAP